MSTDPGLEGLTVAAWLYASLTGDATLQDLAGGLPALQKRVVEGAPYAGPAPWWVEFTVMEPRDVKAVGAIQIMSHVQFQVKVVGPTTSYTPLMPVYRAVHRRLESQVNQNAGAGQVLTSERVSGIQYPERTNGIEYRHLGGLYETLTQ
jgi:hypothetical protein